MYLKMGWGRFFGGGRFLKTRYEHKVYITETHTEWHSYTGITPVHTEPDRQPAISHGGTVVLKDSNENLEQIMLVQWDMSIFLIIYNCIYSLGPKFVTHSRFLVSLGLCRLLHESHFCSTKKHLLGRLTWLE